MPPRKLGPRRHGTRSCYMSGCHRQECVAAHTKYTEMRALRIAAGVTTREAIEPVRELLQELTAIYPMRRIARETGYSYSYLQNILHGTGPKTAPVGMAAELRTLRIYPLPGPKGGVIAIGARRRIEALESQGQSQREIARGCGISRISINRIAVGRTPEIQLSTHNAIVAYYDANWMRQVAVRPKTSRELTPPGAWDDDTIDDPDAKPNWALSDHALATLGRLPKTVLTTLDSLEGNTVVQARAQLQVLAAAGATRAEALAWFKRPSYFQRIVNEANIHFMG